MRVITWTRGIGAQHYYRVDGQSGRHGTKTTSAIVRGQWKAFRLHYKEELRFGASRTNHFAWYASIWAEPIWIYNNIIIRQKWQLFCVPASLSFRPAIRSRRALGCSVRGRVGGRRKSERSVAVHSWPLGFRPPHSQLCALKILCIFPASTASSGCNAGCGFTFYMHSTFCSCAPPHPLP